MWMDDRTNVDVLIADHKYCAFTTYFNLMFSSTSSFHHFDPPPTILAYLEKAEYTLGHPHDGRIAAQLSRIVYLEQVHHLGCPSARKCGILCFSA